MFWNIENRFQCACAILWLGNLWNETESTMVKNHLNVTFCDNPQQLSKSYDEEDLNVLERGRAAGDVTLIPGPVEETTTYSTGTSKIIHLNGDDLKCRGAVETTTKGPRVKGKKNKDRQTTRNSGNSKTREQEALGRTQESLTGKTVPPQDDPIPILDQPSSAPSMKIDSSYYFLSLVIYSIYSAL